MDVSDQLILSYNGKAELPTDAGTYEVTVTFPGNDNINPGAKKATLVIEKAAVTISLDGRSTVYDGAAQQLTGTASHGDEDLSGQLAYTYNGAAKAPADAGTYEVTATFPGTKNLEKASATATLAIAPRAVTVTCGDHTIVSGDTQPVYQTQVADGADGQPAWVGKKSLEDALDLVVSDSRTAATKDTPGTYGITATTDNANFQIVDLAGEPTSAAGTLTVLNRVKVSAGEHGSVAVSGKRQMAENGIDYGASAGDVLNLTATPSSDAYEFKGWKIVSGDAAFDDESAADATLTIGDENIEVEAIFQAKPTKAVKVSVKDDEGGTATVDPAEAYLGQTVTVKADAVEGYSFDHWVVLSGGIELASATDATTTFTMGDSAVQLQAVFKKSATPEPAPSDPSKPGNPSKPNGKADNGNGAKTANTTKSADTTKSDTKLANTGDRMGICAPTAVAGILFAGIGTALLRRRRQ